MTDQDHLDLEARLRRDLAELGGLPSNAARERRSASGRRAAATLVLAVAVVLALVTASYAVVRTTEHRRANVTPGHAPTSSPVVSTRPPVTTKAPRSVTVTTTAPSTTTSTQPSVPLQSVRWASVVYPIQPHCTVPGLPPISVRHVAYVEPAPGTEVAVVMVACSSGAGTPPVALYVFDHATSVTAPHLAATLVTDTDDWQASAFTAAGATIRFPVFGFSKSTLPNCCPDVHATLVWQWEGAGYKLTSSIPPHVTGPPSGYY